MRCTNLPSLLSTFIGREQEVATATRLLHNTRLLTLTGAGGSGKTRLALAVAEPLVRSYQDGVWFVDLAAIEDPDLAPQAVANALNLRGAPGRPLLGALITYLRTKHVLLLLDNCEHMVGASAQLAFALLTAAPRLRIVATSREPLHVAGETIWAVPPLAVPELAGRPEIDKLARIESVRLFVERASRIIPGFTLDEANALPISQICRWLGGSPLAIELAAARIRVLSPAQIAARLGDALGLLVTGDRTVPQRQRSLQAALDWSYGLLSEDEQASFRCLAVFAASFTVEGAAAVHCGSRVLDLLAGLVDKSLLEVEIEAGAERRYRYLEPVRQYAMAKLTQSGGEPAAQRRLLTWAVELAEQLGPGTYTLAARQSVEQLELEHANLRAALAWSLSQAGDTVKGCRLAIALGQFWQQRGYIGEGLAWFEQLLSRAGDAPIPTQIDMFYKVVFLAIHARNFVSARQYLRQGLRLAEAHDDRHGMAQLNGLSCYLTFSEGNLAEAERLCNLTLPMYEQLGDEWGRAIILFYQSNIDCLQHKYRKAGEEAQESVEICLKIGYIPALARRQVRLGLIRCVEGDLVGAKAYLSDGLRNSRETIDSWGMAMALAAMSSLALRQGQLERSAWLVGVTHHYLDKFGVPMWPVDQLEFDLSKSRLESSLGEAGFRAAMARGADQAAKDLEEALQTALDEPKRSVASDRDLAADRPTQRSEPTKLTRRELEVAQLIAKGKSNAEIAAALFVGLRTVEAHVTHILNKLGFNSRSQIAAWIAAQPRE